MLNKISSYLFALLGMIIVMSSCKKEYESIENIDDAKIQEYFSNNNVSATPDPEGTGYYYQILSPGTGAAKFTNRDSVLYRVTIKSLLNGTVYYTTPENSNAGTFVGYTNSGTFTDPTKGPLYLSNATGIRRALLELKPGGSARVILPSYLGFGKNGNDTFGVPSNEILEVLITTYVETKQRALDDRLISEYLTAKGLSAIRDPSGVHYLVVEAGTGTEPIDLTTSLKANYTGRFLSGTVFESNTDGTFAFTLAGLGTNWDVLTKFKKGAKLRLFIPSSEAYGSNPGVGMLPNAILDFDIEILEVTN